MDNYKILTDNLIRINGNCLVTSLICQPTPQQMEKLIEGNGNPESEMRQINSSAGLAVNYWRAYELCHPESKVDFEWKERVPLKQGTPANIDVVVKTGDDIIFIESKFLEPYYSTNEVPRSSYFDFSKYSKNTKDTPLSWIELFKKHIDFKYYNTTQLSRHLLAISKDMWMKPKSYYKKNVKLLSVTWDMPDSFIRLFPKNEISEEFIQRRNVIRDEASSAEQILNKFIKDHLDFENLEFKAIKYNDIIKDIETSPFFSDIKQRYFL